MRTIKDLENDLAKELGYDNFEDYVNDIDGNFYCAERLVKFQRKMYELIQKELLNRVVENVVINGSEFSRCGCEINEQSILNTPIL